MKLQLTGPLRRVDAALRSTRADDEGCQDGRSCEPMENLRARAVADLRSKIIHLEPVGDRRASGTWGLSNKRFRRPTLARRCRATMPRLDSFAGAANLDVDPRLAAQNYGYRLAATRLVLRNGVLERVAGIIALKRGAAGSYYRRSTDREAAAVVVAPIPIDDVRTGG